MTCPPPPRVSLEVSLAAVRGMGGSGQGAHRGARGVASPSRQRPGQGGGALGPPHSELSRFMQSVKLLGLTFPSYFG